MYYECTLAITCRMSEPETICLESLAFAFLGSHDACLGAFDQLAA
jgi:hypothetical protein